jgi:hypothetical protein
MVRSCAERVSTEGTSGRRRVLITASSLAALLLVAAGVLEWGFPVVRESFFSEKAALSTVEKIPDPAVVSSVAPAPAEPPSPALPQPASPSFSAWNTKKPKVLGRMIVESGETVYGMLFRVYGAYDEEQLQAFVRANPRIKNINMLLKGDIVTLPAVSVGTNPLPPEQSWVAVATKGSLGEAYESLRRYSQAEGGVRLFPSWNPREGMVFDVLIRKGFPDEKAAGAFIQRLPAEFPPGARVIAKWTEGTEFYAR